MGRGAAQCRDLPHHFWSSESRVTVLSTWDRLFHLVGVMNLSADQGEIDIDFPTPVLPGQSFSDSLPIDKLETDRGRSCFLSRLQPRRSERSRRMGRDRHACSGAVWTRSRIA